MRGKENRKISHKQQGSLQSSSHYRILRRLVLERPAVKIRDRAAGSRGHMAILRFFVDSRRRRQHYSPSLLTEG